jgi:hypothetical protein
MANLFPNIEPGTTTGSVAASVLNTLGRSDESAIKVVSGSEVLSSSSGYYKEGSLVFSKNEKKIYEVSGGSFVDSGSTVAPSNMIFTTGDIKQVELYRETLSGSGIFIYPSSGSINQDYDHIRLILKYRSSAATEDSCLIFFNNDTTETNYRSSYHYGGHESHSYGAVDFPFLTYAVGADGVAGDFSFAAIDIPLYAGSQRKLAQSKASYRKNDLNMWVYDTTIFWESTSPINQITIQPDGYDTDKFVPDSFIQIIGIKTV